MTHNAPYIHQNVGQGSFFRLRSGPFEGPAIVIPPALPEDTYSLQNLKTSWVHGAFMI